MKEVTKDVILDLLPLYIAGEVSEATAALVKKYLESDLELAETAKEMAKADSLGKVPIPFKKRRLLWKPIMKQKMDDNPHTRTGGNHGAYSHLLFPGNRVKFIHGCTE